MQLADGRVIQRAAVFIRPRSVPHPDGLLTGLACELDDAGFTVVDATGRTSAFGVWAAGNAVDPRAQVIASAGAGNAAAIAINADLVQEAVDRAVDDHAAAGGIFSAAFEAHLAGAVVGRPPARVLNTPTRRSTTCPPTDPSALPCRHRPGTRWP